MRRLLLLIILLTAASFAQCAGEISQYVPAVVGEDGGLVNVTMSLASGDGDVYVTAYPRTGLSTQESAAQAVSYAKGLSGRGSDACDVLVSFGANRGTDYVDGPSAGAALTVMAYALFENRTMRDDTIMTGTIEPSGAVGPVGGLYEKAKGAAARGAEHFITPVENIYEMMLLRSVESQYGIDIIQAKRVDDIIGFMLDNKSIEQEGLNVEPREIPDVPAYDYSGFSGFLPVAARMVEYEKNLTGSIGGGDNESEAIAEFYSNEGKRQERLIERGYLFSAANEAFLNYIDLSTIKAIRTGEPDLARAKGGAGICLSGIKRGAMTDRNFEWVVGSDLRQAWAYLRINSTDIDDLPLIDEKAAAYNELMFAQAWCLVSKELLAAAPSGGTEIDEGAWRGIAEEKLAEARASYSGGEDTSEKLGSAESSFGEGRYGASIFDSVYVIENEGAAAESPDESNVSALVNESRSSLWGRVYQSHAAFLMTQNGTGTAYRTARFARGLDEAVAEMRGAMTLKNGTALPSEPAAQGAPLDYALIGAAAGISFLFLILLYSMTRRLHGDKRKGFGEIPRAEQKKGRARVREGGPRLGI